LEQRQVGIGEPAAEEEGPAAAPDDLFEIRQELRQPVLQKIRRAALGFATLILVVEIDRDRVMRVMGLDHEVRDRELQLMGPQPHRLVARRKPLACAEVEQDVGGLADHELAALEERRRERRMLDAPAVEQLHHRGHAGSTRLARDVDVIGAALFEREAHEFAASLDRGPVVKLIAHHVSLRAGGAYILSYSTKQTYFSTVTNDT
jgi:hypothetical protein